MRRRDLIVTLAGVPLWTHRVLPARRAMAAGLGFAWTKMPAITIIGTTDDPRQALTRHAVAFWNDTFADLGSGFRLGATTQGPESVPDATMAGMSHSVLSGTKPEFPPELAAIPVTSSSRCRTLTSSRTRRTGQTAGAWLRSRAGTPIR